MHKSRSVNNCLGSSRAAMSHAARRPMPLPMAEPWRGWVA